jgi:regulator of protease activity HflC (stomatin/prohibitin superfamily)
VHTVEPVQDVQVKLDEIVAMVESARAMPMSASCVINRAELLGQLDELKELLPGEFRQARYLLQDRDEVVAEGRREAERIIEEAQEERLRLIDETDLVRDARAEAGRIIDNAAEEAAGMRREVDDYVDTKLANFEVVLTRTLGAVERGRDKLRGRREVDDLHDMGDLDDESPLPDLDEPATR